MADIADQAYQESEFHHQLALSGRPRFEGESLRECEDCGFDIEEKRRELLRGVRKCVSCQDIAERLEGRR